MNTIQPALYILVGLPGSGKSTWTKSFVATALLHSLGRRLVVISTDDILEEIAKEKGIGYNEAFRHHMGYADKEMKLRAKLAFEEKADIIWDQTNLSPKARAKILNKTPKEYEKVAVLFEVEEKELTERLNRRAAETGKFISPKLIEEMKGRYVTPTKNEGFDVIFKANER